MSTNTHTETVKACPHGHISLRKNTGTPFGGVQAESEYYCKTCSNKHSGGGRVNPHYERHELIEKKRRVNDELEYDLTMGYVWSPSHDE